MPKECDRRSSSSILCSLAQEKADLGCLDSSKETWQKNRLPLFAILPQPEENSRTLLTLPRIFLWLKWATTDGVQANLKVFLEVRCREYWDIGRLRQCCVSMPNFQRSWFHLKSAWFFTSLDGPVDLPTFLFAAPPMLSTYLAECKHFTFVSRKRLRRVPLSLHFKNVFKWNMVDPCHLPAKMQLHQTLLWSTQG